MELTRKRDRSPAIEPGALHPARVAAAHLESTRAQASAPEEGADGARSARARGEALSAALTSEGGRKAYLSRRPAPKLHRQPNGSYRWFGPVFTARIGPDGRVTFDDEPDLVVDGFGIAGLGFRRERPAAYEEGEREDKGDPLQAGLRVGDVSVGALPAPRPRPEVGEDIANTLARGLAQTAPLLSLFGHFDLESALQKAHGDDPHAAERRWFLEQTAGLRHELQELQKQHGGRSQGHELSR